MSPDDVKTFVWRELERFGRKLRNAFARGVLNMVADGLKMQANQVQLLDGEVLDNVERAQQYGFTSVPQAGAEVFVAFVGGDRGHGVVLAVDDRRYRLKGLKGGEVALYTDEGDSIILKRDNHIEVKTRHYKVMAEDDYTVETKRYAVNASQQVQITTADTRFATDGLGFASQGAGAVTAELTGGINASEDVTANNGAVSLRQHTHTGVQPGSGTSDKPVGG